MKPAAITSWAAMNVLNAPSNRQGSTYTSCGALAEMRSNLIGLSSLKKNTHKTGHSMYYPVCVRPFLLIKNAWPETLGLWSQGGWVFGLMVGMPEPSVQVSF